MSKLTCRVVVIFVFVDVIVHAAVVVVFVVGRRRRRGRLRRRRRRRGGFESELLWTVASQFRPSISGWSGTASLR